MGGSVLGTDFIYGFPGTIARHGDEVIKSRPVHSGATIPFGTPVVLYKDNGVSDGTVQPFGANDTSADFVGIACRKTKHSISADENFGKYHDNEIADIIERGSVMVVCPTGSPSPGSKVYIRVALNTTDYPDAKVGDIEAVSDTVTNNGQTTYNNLEITNCKFFSGKDANNVVELVILERQGV